MLLRGTMLVDGLGVSQEREIVFNVREIEHMIESNMESEDKEFIIMDVYVKNDFKKINCVLFRKEDLK